MRRSNLIRLFVLAILFYGVVRIRRQFVFQQFLSHSKVKFDDFPSKYVEALDAAVSSGHEPLDFDYASTFTRNQIPRIIHFISFKNIYQSSEGTDDIPLLGSRAPQLCQQYNPDYDIRIWNATNALEFLTAEYEWFLPIYNNYRYPIQRIDALKYFLLWHYGGVYMDLDIACRRPLDPLLDFPIWFPEASPLGVNNDLMASIPKHPIFGKMTTALATHNRNFIFPYLTIFCSTGPQFTSDIVQEHFESLSANGPSKELPAQDALFILPSEFYSEEYTFFGHSPGGTWHGGDVAMVLWLVDRPFAMLSTLVVLILLIIGISLKLRYQPSRPEEKGFSNTV